MRSKADINSECPVGTTVQLIGNKWKLLIIRNLLAKPQRFTELRHSLNGISPKVLTESLRAMEANGIVHRAEPGTPPRSITYSLTPLGESLRPILHAMEQWGKHYQNQHPTP